MYNKIGFDLGLIVYFVNIIIYEVLILVKINCIYLLKFVLYFNFNFN